MWKISQASNNGAANWWLRLRIIKDWGEDEEARGKVAGQSVMNYDYMIEQRGKETADGKSVTMKQWPDQDFLSSARVTGYYERDYDENVKRQQERRTSRHKRHKKQRVWSERLVDGFRSFVAFLFSNVGIVCLVVGYTITGAFIFSAIEGTHELTVINRRSNVSIIRNSTATTLWNLTSKVRHILSMYFSPILFLLFPHSLSRRARH